MLVREKVSHPIASLRQEVAGRCVNTPSRGRFLARGTDVAKRNAGPCSIDGCDEPSAERGWCKRHYMKWYRHGDPLWERPPKMTHWAARHPEEKKAMDAAYRERIKNDPKLLEKRRKYARDWARNKQAKLRDEGVPFNETPEHKWARRKREFLAAYKVMMGCADCGYYLHHACLEFDHVFAPKAKNRMYQMSWTDVRAELEKCEVVCSNCHRIRVYDNWYEHGHPAGLLGIKGGESVAS